MQTTQTATPSRRSPGRPRAFEPEKALRAARGIFWEKGFERTSLDDLTAAMGLSRSSFYAEFGSKHATLIRAVTLYVDELMDSLHRTAAGAQNPRDAVFAVAFGVCDPEGGRQGCFLANCLADLADHDPIIEEIVQRHVAHVEALLEPLLEQCGQDDPVEIARALVAVILGLILARKAGVAEQQLRRTLTYSLNRFV